MLHLELLMMRSLTRMLLLLSCLSSQVVEVRCFLSVIPRLVEDVVPVSPHTLTLEQIREAETRSDLVLGDDIVAVLRLIDDELADL